MEYKALGELCDVVSGGTPSRSKQEYWNGDIPWIKIGNIKSKYVSEADEFITEAGLSGSSAKMLKKGTILYTIFATLGEAGVLTIDACTNQAIAGITIKDESVIDRDYLFYYLKSKKKYVNKVGRGVAQNNINMSILRGFEVPIRKLHEQQEITNILDKTSSIIEDRRQELEKLDELIKARFVEVFGNPVTNDKGWSTDSCKNLMKKIGSGATPKGGRESYCDEGISLIRSMNVYNNRFAYKDLAHITDEQAEQLDNVTIEKSDVLLNITGASVARCCVVPDDLLPARVNQHVSIIRCKENLLPEFVCSMFTEDNYQRLLWNIATAGGATREAITKQQIEDLQLIVPPLDLQKQFMEFVNQVDKSKVVALKAA